MQVKFFEDTTISDLETAINAWLAHEDQADITVNYVTPQSQCAGSRIESPSYVAAIYYTPAV